MVVILKLLNFTCVANIANVRTIARAPSRASGTMSARASPSNFDKPDFLKNTHY